MHTEAQTEHGQLESRKPQKLQNMRYNYNNSFADDAPYQYFDGSWDKLFEKGL